MHTSRGADQALFRCHATCYSLYHSTPPAIVPCHLCYFLHQVGSYWPSRTCDLSNDIAVCNRGESCAWLCIKEGARLHMQRYLCFRVVSVLMETLWQPQSAGALQHAGACSTWHAWHHIQPSRSSIMEEKSCQPVSVQWLDTAWSSASANSRSFNGITTLLPFPTYTLTPLAFAHSVTLVHTKAPHSPATHKLTPYLTPPLRRLPHAGWGVYGSKDVCCSPNVAFPEGCSPEPDSATPAAVAAATAVPAAAARQAAGTAAPRVTAQSRDKLLGKR